MSTNNNNAKTEYRPVELDEEEAVVATAVEEVPTASATTVKATALPMIEVVAPATLPEGYAFEAEVGGRVITVTVVRVFCWFVRECSEMC